MFAVMADQCEFGLKSQDRWGEAAAKKPTRFLTNSYHVGDALAVRCQNEKRAARDQHRHVQLIAGKAKMAQVYPRGLCEAMARGMQNQMESDKWNVVKVRVNSAQEKPPKHDEDEDDHEIEQWAWDDITGAKLDPKEVERERQKEIGTFASMGYIAR